MHVLGCGSAPKSVNGSFVQKIYLGTTYESRQEYINRDLVLVFSLCKQCEKYRHYKNLVKVGFIVTN